MGRADFTLLEDGREQPIALFSPAGAAPAAARAERAPGDFSNHGADTPSSLTVVLFDRLNTPADAQRFARDRIVKFLSQIRNDDVVALYALDSSTLRILHAFSSDAASLSRALAASAAREPAELDKTESASEALAPWLKGTSRALTEMGTDARSLATIDALQSIANQLAGVRGRKNLVWVSANFPVSFRPGGAAGTFDRAARALDDADVAIYPVDARGLSAAPIAAAETPTPSPRLAGPPVPAPPPSATLGSRRPPSLL
jgi:VWFA-related protein